MDANPNENSKPPLVTVVMAVRNGMPFLQAAVESILTQTFQDFEFIIVDDGSTDEGSGYLDALEDERVRVLRNDINLGLTKSLNKALGEARGHYIARMDADDISVVERLAVQSSFLNEHSDIHLLDTRHVEFITTAPDELPVYEGEPWQALLYEDLLKRNTLCHSSVMFRADAAKECGGYREVFTCSQDYDLWLRMVQRGAVARLNQVLCLFRRHSNSVGLKYPYEQRHFVLCAQKMARQRESQAQDCLQLEGRLPEINADEEKHIRRSVAEIYLEFSYRMLQSGKWLTAGSLFFRGLLFAPVHTLRGMLSLARHGIEP